MPMRRIVILMRLTCTCDRIRNLNITGTSVNERTRLASRDTITDSDIGLNRYLAVP